MYDYCKYFDLSKVTNHREFVRANISFLVALIEFGISRAAIAGFLKERGLNKIEPATLTRYIASFRQDADPVSVKEYIRALQENMHQRPQVSPSHATGTTTTIATESNAPATRSSDPGIAPRVTVRDATPDNLQASLAERFGHKQ
jgi:hypothetical protein